MGLKEKYKEVGVKVCIYTSVTARVVSPTFEAITQEREVSDRFQALANITRTISELSEEFVEGMKEREALLKQVDKMLKRANSPPPKENEPNKLESPSEKAHGFFKNEYNVVQEKGEDLNVLGRPKITSLSGQARYVEKEQEQTASKGLNVLGKPKITSLTKNEQTKEMEI